MRSLSNERRDAAGRRTGKGGREAARKIHERKDRWRGVRSEKDVAVTSVDALCTVRRAAGTGAEGRSMQLRAGTSANQVLRIGFCRRGEGEEGSLRERVRDRLQGQDKQGLQVEPKGRRGPDAEPFMDPVLGRDVRRDTESR